MACLAAGICRLRIKGNERDGEGEITEFTEHTLLWQIGPPNHSVAMFSGLL